MPLCAQTFDVQLNPSMYARGYNISCHGSNNGAINTYIIGGTAPFTFVWSNGATTKNLSNLTAGLYQVTVTSSNGISVNSEIILIEPDAFFADVVAEERGGGYHVSEFGGSDGVVMSNISGGVPPYTYLWSSGQSVQNLDGVVAGTYTLTVHDATNCVTAATVTVIEPTLLHLVSISSPKVVGNYNISCAQFGTINVVVAGGRPPYEYQWDHGPQTQQVNDAEDAGLYTVHVTDDNRVEIVASITLSKTPTLTAGIAAFTYPDSKNTSCYNCNNGSIALSINSGTAPYTYTWNNGSNQQNPSNLAAGIYGVVINDAAGCSSEKTAILTAPEREDWTMNGNANTDSTRFIGTTDNKDFVFKRNGAEIMRLDTSGVKFEKLITAKSGIALNASQTYKITYDSTAGTETIQFGTIRSKLQTCITPANTIGIGLKYIFDGSIFFRPANPVGSTNASLAVGSAAWNGSGVIEVEGTDENGGTTNGLLINYFCGRDVKICTNPLAGGFVSTGNNFEVGFPYPPRQVNIAANIKGASKIGLRVETLPAAGGLDPNYNTQLSVRSSATKIIGGFLFNTSGYDQDVFSIKGNGETNFGTTDYPTFFIQPFINNAFQYQVANIGIGTVNPQERLHIEGNVRISGLGNGTALNLVQADADGKLSKVSSTSLSGLGLWETSNGTDVFRSNGKVGIGVSSPKATFQVGDGWGSNISMGNFADDWNNSQSTTFLNCYIGFNATRDNESQLSQKWTINNGQGAALFVSSLKGDIRIISIPALSGQNLPNRIVDDSEIKSHEKLILRSDGRIGMGTSLNNIPYSHTDGFRLYVKDGIKTEKIMVELSTDWSDYVFDSKYQLTPIERLEDYIQMNHHLPNIPTAMSLKKEGLDLGLMQSLQMEKIEELTLYIIKQEKAIKNLEHKLDELLKKD